MTTSKVFNVFEKEVISKDSEYKWIARKIRDPKPSWKDFADKRVAVSKYHCNQVKEYLERKHFCILVGAKDTGKTWLSYALGYNFVEQGKRVRFTTIDKNSSAEDAWNEIEDMKGKNKPDRYFIVEDCHTNCKESEEFLKTILNEGEENLRFLFTMRKTGKALIEDELDIFYDEGVNLGCIVRLLPNEMIKEHVKNIITKFIKIKEIKNGVSEQELEYVAKSWGNDLYWVYLRLNSWKYDKGQKLSDITDDQVYNSIWSDRYEIKLSLMKRQKILLPIAGICQFELLKVTESFLRGQDIDEGTLKELKKEGIIDISGKEYELLSIQEGFADIILSCVLKKDPSFQKNYSSKENYTVQIIKDYLIQNPPNCGDIFSALYSARETEKASSAKQILSSLHDDAYTWEIVKENVKEMSLGQIDSLLDSVLWAAGSKKIKENRKALEIKACYLEHNYKNIQDKLKSSSATAIWKYLRLLGRMTNLEKFFNAFSISDFKRIINLSTINSIRILIFGLMESRKRKFSSALFSWDKIPGNDNERLREYLKQNFAIDWAKTAEIEKIDDAKTIRVSTEKNFLSLILNDEKTEVNLKIDDGRTHEFIVRMENSELNIYEFYLHQGAPSAAKKMAKALPDADLARLLSQENSSLYRLGGLIGYVMQINPSAARRFIEKLSEIDLGDLFSREDSLAEMKDYTKAETINFFLSKWISFAPLHRKRIVQNVNDEIWSHLIRSASSDHGFWLLWNIYVNDSIKAKRLVQNNTGKFLLHKCNEDQNVVFYLPLLGVLHLSDFAIHRIPLIEADITQIKQILMTFKKENKITLIVLSLVALKVKLPQEQFKDVKGILDEQLIKFIRNNQDIQIRELLNNQIEHFVTDA